MKNLGTRLIQYYLLRSDGGEKIAAHYLSKSVEGNELLYCHRLRDHLKSIGWIESCKRHSAVNEHGQCLPWFTYPSISFLSARIRSDFCVFEYGSGNSTLWWAERVSRVVSCEHDRTWHKQVSKDLPSNATCTLHELTSGDDYCNYILEFSAVFHIVVVDGRNRVQCAENSLSALREDGVIIWDNADRERYAAGYEYLVTRGFKRLDFDGLSPFGRSTSRTSVFYRSNNCLDL